MKNYVSGENKPTKEAILEAITSLRSRKCDINAYTLAAECNIPRSLIIADHEIMQLLESNRLPAANGATKNSADHIEPSAGIAANSMEAKLREKLDKLHYVETELRGQLSQASARENELKDKLQKCVVAIKALREQVEASREENSVLQKRFAALEEESANIAKSVNIAWQQGYLAGQNAAMMEAADSSKSFIDTLNQAAQAATEYGVTAESIKTSEEQSLESPNESDQYGAESAVATHAEAAPHVPDSMPYVGELVLPLDDPEVLNDPFTTKLMNALQSSDSEQFAAESHDSPVAAMHAQEYEEASFDLKHSEGASTVQPQPVTGYDNEFDVMPDGLEVDEPVGVDANGAESDEGPSGDGKQGFTAEELHSLFRNKYVRDDEAEAAKPAPQPEPIGATTGTTKKFVGSKHAGAEPAGPVPRSFPPEIRKACRLLGLNPEEATRATVIEAWKREMAKPGVHPDTGGDTEMAIFLNTAKDALVRWCDDQAPKLGKKFGAAKPKQE